MAKYNRVVIETGQKKVFASALDWPGWCRSAKTEEDALDTLAAYGERYAKVAVLAGVDGMASAVGEMDVVEHVIGNTTTDFGAPDKPAVVEREPLTDAECERQIKLLHACWEYFDDTASRVSEELRKGPRGGGRNRSKIVFHVLEAERGYARQIGVKTPKGSLDTPAGLTVHREAVCQTIREIAADESVETKWPLRYFIRRAAWHVMDHAWEMEDKDLTGVEDQDSVGRAEA